jgi:hypothetical protein
MNIVDKIHELKEDGYDFTPTWDESFILRECAVRGVRTLVVLNAMNIVRQYPETTNLKALEASAKEWGVIRENYV